MPFDARRRPRVQARGRLGGGRREGPSGVGAFTLLELLIVLAVLSIVFFVVTPRFISTVNPAAAKTFVRRMHNTLLYANDKAVLEKKVYLFTLDLDERRYSFTLAEEGNPEGRVRDRYLAPVHFPKGLVVKSVQLFPGDRVDTGKVVVPFTPKGLLYAFEIIVFEKRGTGGDTYLAVRGDSLSNDIEILRLEEAAVR
jgi:prepilin-type N-terminal cleavage/methylation domain-containing protein